MMFGSTKLRRLLAMRDLQLSNIRERAELLDDACGVGLWEAVLFQGDAMHAKSIWTWSPEFRRLLGYESESEYPNVVQSWSDRLHPDDVAPTFAAFVGHLADKSGRSRYDVTYRLKVRDGSYRWFRATGGCRYASDGQTVRACGSLTDIHKQKVAEFAAATESENDKLILTALTKALSALASGDLTTRINEMVPPKSQSLKDDFNRAAVELQETMKQIATKKDAIHAGSGEVTSATDDLSQRTEQQAASLEETAAALDQITATVKKTAQGASHAREVVGNAKGDAERSGEVVGRAISAMNNIEKSAVQIGQIIGVIDEIAFQTNLLALNAGVEAARAGEAGRGFAVVASEVRALAQRSAEAAKEIKALIHASDSQVKVGVELVGETGQALSRIVGQVADLNVAVAEIAASAQEQAAGLQQVNTAINQMDQVTQKNAAMVEETTAAAHNLSQDADELARLVARFDIGADVVERPAHRTARTSRPVPAMKTVGRGGAARQPAKAASAETEWEEF
ncbi:methyl-accepting chemotaxis protein [Lichenifustis flavocetrariae]|uniref:Methyl-accepting chemotaxis protein n=1 Tax=Lichenifustis flavocetrariae TaxID=2949735 RepID=A0AA42CRW1_9HYPH|nr:methyl-accepting chemotaxis protein [Lichenifustis flavocetrariae]MCW6512875.1 methyl-accepting chemotaxis protein [Lichenifustis flavocetrariae]